MFSDMDDMYFTNPSEADSIIDEATDRLRDLIKDDVKCVVDAYNKALRRKEQSEKRPLPASTGKNSVLRLILKRLRLKQRM